MTRYLAALTLALIACTEPVSLPEAPAVRIILDDSVPAADRHNIESGALPWEALGFVFSFPTYDEAVADQQPECGGRWYETEHPSECTISILVSKEQLAPSVALAFTDRPGRRIDIDTEVVGYDLFPVTVHELGHALITSKHLAPGLQGMMAAELDTSGKLSAADLDLVCSTIGMCL